MSRVLQKVNNFANYVLSRNYDYFVVITGNEGTGKSRGLMLNLADDWYNRVLKKKPTHLPFVTDFFKYPDLLDKSKKFDMAILDEAGDTLDNTQLGSKAKNLIYRSYTIIREKGLYSIIVLPSIFDLYGKFVRRRVNLLLHADHRVDNYCKKDKIFFVGDKCPKCNRKPDVEGYVYFVGYRKKALQALIDINQDQKIKSMSLVKPTFTGKVKEYKGEWANHYTELKRYKTDETLTKLKDEISKMTGNTKADKIKCPNCDAKDVRYSKKRGMMTCRRCGYEFTPDFT